MEYIGSYYKVPKAIVYLLQGDYILGSDEVTKQDCFLTGH